MVSTNKKDNPIIDSKTQLLEWFESGVKSVEKWRIGTEHEKFAYNLKDYSPLSYKGSPGIQDLLAGMQRFGWTPVFEGEHVIALSSSDGSNISLEPGGQFELSGAPLETLHQTCDEVQEHLRQIRQVNKDLGIGMIGIGFHPYLRREDVPWMPKNRYQIMRDYMPKKGSMGLDMMLRTCTVQVNLDFSSEKDMARKMRVGMALQPIVTALFSNSPFYEGKATNYKSFRSRVWTDVDPDRSGILPFVFEDNFSFEHYMEYALDVPMYFIIRDGKYIDVSGQSFRDFLNCNLVSFPGEKPLIKDWEDHLTTLFPEVRLKQFIEMRGADGGPWRRVCALPAFWVGLLYDSSTLDESYQMIKDWKFEEVNELRNKIPESGLDSMFRNRKVIEIAREALELSRKGLKNRQKLDFWSQDESHFLSTLEQIVDSGITPAENKLAAFNGRWGQNVNRAFEEYAY
ncbi:MAG: glutamate--cysteine ligase [Alphaproteobacteria bacterium]|jgi:glutamate--cysteine ligase|nr:glutamate--cysteine ligase [Alphaproteobacteria bacterium]PPR14413.1 MAG: Glutamate--cysteine ligase EgtA [Alphaproteobacteria bacterium MarineAlpha12_Bin1]|tara:strand:- start:5266 stop:6633 length:1368 start_codon:yes stop_codon:yes gene_type:complete